MRLYNSKRIPHKTKRFQNGSQVSWVVLTSFDKRQFDCTQFPSHKTMGNFSTTFHIATIWFGIQTPPQHLPRLPNTTRGGANSRSFVPTLKATPGHHNVKVTWPADVIRWYLSSHTRSWSIGQWPVPTQATGSEQWEWWECSSTQGISWGPCVSVPPEGSIGGCGIEMWTWKATTQNFNPALQLWCQRKSSLHGETYTSMY